ncbi:MAG: hypothetical protein HQ541_16705, partial [Mariniphaga sp.]|nr:hypothetical protein [Mariniphaga sp.]
MKKLVLLIVIFHFIGIHLLSSQNQPVEPVFYNHFNQNQKEDNFIKTIKDIIFSEPVDFLFEPIKELKKPEIDTNQAIQLAFSRIGYPNMNNNFS